MIAQDLITKLTAVDQGLTVIVGWPKNSEDFDRTDQIRFVKDRPEHIVLRAHDPSPLSDRMTVGALVTSLREQDKYKPVLLSWPANNYDDPDGFGENHDSTATFDLRHEKYKGDDVLVLFAQ